MEVYDWPRTRFVAGFIGTPGMNFIEGRIELVDGEWTFRRGSWSVSLAARRLNLPGEVNDYPATLGVRPEDVSVATSPAPGSQPGVVEVVEMLGDVTVATIELKTGPATETGGPWVHEDEPIYVVSKSDARADLQPGLPVWICVKESRLHAFDSDSGQNLVTGGPPWRRSQERAS